MRATRFYPAVTPASLLCGGNMVSGRKSACATNSSGGELANFLRDAGSTSTWCRVRHWWAMIGDPGKPVLDP
ncbi:hypothetical protein Hanom_Chr05g00471111 [Helianthus anomalus]